MTLSASWTKPGNVASRLGCAAAGAYGPRPGRSLSALSKCTAEPSANASMARSNSVVGLVPVGELNVKSFHRPMMAYEIVRWLG